jgi:hypothetical protein
VSNDSSWYRPEKRQFFLEGQRMAQFAIPREADLVFTRRIGLSAEGDVVPMIAGARLSGREGRTTIGAMNIETEAMLGLPAENFTALRVRRDFLARSSVRALFTHRAGGGRFNRVFGADVSFLFNNVWALEGFLARMDEPARPRAPASPTAGSPRRPTGSPPPTDSSTSARASVPARASCAGATAARISSSSVTARARARDGSGSFT